MRYSFQLLKDAIPEPLVAAEFPSEHQMKEEAKRYLLEVAGEARILPCCLSLVVRDEKGRVSSLVLSITDQLAN